MAGLIGLLAAVALVIWFVSRPKRAADPSPVADREELEAAERELADDGNPRVFDGQDDEDDWGPGAPSR
ncbi:MAG: hypothetical protein KF785_14830 [Gemmatimonadales bacterium]|mgnify:FL=1|nr:hypothetical protein [Gemmatimonadales bacterium]